MNSDNTPLVNRLILLVLSLILVCLVMLVIRAYQQPGAPDTTAGVTEAQPPAAEEILTMPVEVAPPRRPEPLRRPSPTNSQRLVAGSRPVQPAPPRETDFAAPTEQPVATPITQSEVIAVRETGVLERGANGTTYPAQFGEIYGTVWLSGTPKPEIPIDMGPTCGAHLLERRTTRHFVVGPETGPAKVRGLANVLVYVRGVEHIIAKFAKPQEVPLLDQIDCMYEPYVMSVMVGQKFRIRNSDPTLHNIHATPKVNAEFNFGQPLKGQVNERSFSKPELFTRIKCDVHPWMFAYINVVPHPFFAVTDTNGLFQLPPGLPSGSYTVVASHIKAGELTTNINLEVSRGNPLSLKFTVPSSVQPQGRIARAE